MTSPANLKPTKKAWQKGDPYTLGLDVGIASVGAALLSEDTSEVIALHVRTFDKAETAKNGESLNLIRRQARGARRRLRRRAHRLECLRRIFFQHRLLASDEPVAFTKDSNEHVISPWQARAEGLDRILTPPEWAAALYHIVKHRGFQSNRKAERKDKDVDALLDGVKANKEKMKAEGYRSVGEMVWKDASFAKAKRNKGGSYKNTFDRAELEAELKDLFERQRELGNGFASPHVEQAVHKWLMTRRPTFSGKQIEEMVGHCTFEPGEKRAAKACHSAEHFIWQGKLHSMRIGETGAPRALSQDEMRQLQNLPFEKASVTFAHIKKHLDLPKKYRCNLVRYLKNDDIDKAEKTTKLFEAKAFHTLKKAYEKGGIPLQWDKDKRDRAKLDTLGTVLTTYRDDASVREKLQELGIEHQVIEAVLGLEFSTYLNLSLKAINKILPFMKQGERYDQACQCAGYQHSDQSSKADKRGRLPGPDKNKIRNPVVLRSLNQARKLINAIIKHYGTPSDIHIEMGRDLAKPLQERQTIEKEQKTYREKKEQLAQEYCDHFDVIETTGLNLLKYRLYQEQDCKCAYSQGTIDLNRLNEHGYVQVDHILPYSRSFDDSLNNKALVLASANQNKGNKTPFEWMGEDEESPRWQAFKAYVEATSNISQAKRSRYLRKDFGTDAAKKFKERNLNDTRYVGTALKDMIEAHIRFAESPSSTPDKPGQKRQRCTVLSGRLTSLLRTRWGFHKVREDGDLHHAMDAAVIAACSHGMVQRMARQSKYKELEHITGTTGQYEDAETGEIINPRAWRAQHERDEEFPKPWDRFREDVLDALKQVRVSRAPTRRGLGAAHQETIRGKVSDAHQIDDKGSPKYYSVLNTSIDKLKEADLKDIAGYHDPRNQAMMQALAAWLGDKDNREATHKQQTTDLKQRHKTELASAAESEKDCLKAQHKEEMEQLAQRQQRDATLYKPTRDGKQGPPVRSVKLLNTKEGKSGIEVRGGLANNDSMIRIDIFKDRQGKHYVVPLYVADVVRDTLPNKAAPNGEVMDENYKFLFSLYANDWVTLTNKKQTIAGYYKSFDIAGGGINIEEHDRDKRKGTHKHKDTTTIPGLHRGCGIKNAKKLEKYHVDLLGNLYPAKPEPRKPLREGQTV